MKLNEKASELTELERDVLEHIDAETGTYRSEAWIVEIYCKARGKAFSGVCSSLIQKGILRSKGDSIYITKKGFDYIAKDNENYKFMLDDFEIDEKYKAC